MFGELTPMDGALGFLYETRASLVFFGILFACSGLMLLYGKWRRSRKWTGRGLMFIYCEFLFATIINGIAYNWVPGYWVGNAVATAIVAALWLRWKFKTEYVNPRHFRDDMHHFRGDTSNVNRE